MNDTQDAVQPPSLEERDFSFFDFVQITVDHLRPLILVPLIMAVAVTALVALLVEPKFTSETRFLAPQPPQSMGGAGATGGLGIQSLAVGVGSSLRNPADVYLSFLRSNRLRDVIIDEFDLMVFYKLKTKDQARRVLDKIVAIQLSKDNIITVTVTHPDAELAAKMANAYPRELRKIVSRFALEEAETRRAYYVAQVATLKDKIKSMENTLKATGMSVDVLKLDMGASVAEVANLKAAIASAEIRLRAMRSYLADTAPEFKIALGELDSLRTQLNKVQNSTPTQTKNENYQEVFRDYVFNLELIALLTKQAELAQFDVNRGEIHLQVLDVAEPAPRKNSPSLTNTLLITGLVSGFLLLIWFLVVHGFRRAAQDPITDEKFKRIKQGLRQAWSIQTRKTAA
ncbi:MAG: Tyrosine-protein kinase ptk [Pseudomonadota bacterium]|jgi:uncharacterized protein involved in exopolysaccharide biosynthesis